MNTDLATLSAIALFAAVAVAQNTLRVPSQHPTIGGAIAAASSGDTVLVAAGSYTESLEIAGKDLVLRSESGPGRTTIRGDGSRPVIRILGSAVTRATRIEGFTITGGRGHNEGGGFEVISGAAPVIARNVIENNVCCSGGGGIAAGFASPRIEHNLIRNNRQSGCSGGIGGGGISVRGASTCEILHNVIEDNQHGSWGGGIALFAAGQPEITYNLIRGNRAGSAGGGISIVNVGAEFVGQNLIVENLAPRGAGMDLGGGGGSTAITFVGNTIARNRGGSCISAFWLDQFFSFHDNLIQADEGAFLVTCSRTSSTTGTFRNNLFFNSAGGLFDPNCPTGIVGTNGNISTDPLFVDAAFGDYHLRRDSPCVDAGTNTLPGPLARTDFWGDQRAIDGDGNGTADIDIGADEESGRRPYGVGCANTVPYPPRIATDGGLPFAGNHSFAIELRDARPNADCALFLGVSRTQWNSRLLPWALDPFGMPGCLLLTSVNDCPYARTDGAGVARHAFPLPANPTFVGLRVHAQWIVAGPGSAFLPGDISDAIQIEIR